MLRHSLFNPNMCRHIPLTFHHLMLNSSTHHLRFSRHPLANIMLNHQRLSSEHPCLLSLVRVPSMAAVGKQSEGRWDDNSQIH
jgi:hypothetical protein